MGTGNSQGGDKDRVDSWQEVCRRGLLRGSRAARFTPSPRTVTGLLKNKTNQKWEREEKPGGHSQASAQWG